MHTHYFFSIKWILSTGSIFTCPARYCFWSPAFVCLLASLRLQLSLRNIQRYWDNGVIGLTRSSAVAERPRDASFLSVDSFIQYVERNLLLFAVLPLQIYRCARTDKFCSSVLFCSAYSLMRGDLCHKQTLQAVHRRQWIVDRTIAPAIIGRQLASIIYIFIRSKEAASKKQAIKATTNKQY